MNYKTVDVRTYTEEMFKANLAIAIKARESMMTALVAIDMVARVSPDAAHTIYELTYDIFGNLLDMIEHFKEEGERNEDKTR